MIRVTYRVTLLKSLNTKDLCVRTAKYPTFPRASAGVLSALTGLWLHRRPSGHDLLPQGLEQVVWQQVLRHQEGLGGVGAARDDLVGAGVHDARWVLTVILGGAVDINGLALGSSLDLGCGGLRALGVLGFDHSGWLGPFLGPG